MLITVLAGVALASGAAGAVPSAETGWTITDLGTLGGQESEAFAINEAGQIVGWSDGRGFVRLSKRLLPVGDLVSAINERGQAIGYFYEDDRQQAFVWERGKRRALANLGGSCAKSMPAAINARGHVVGWAGDMENCSLSLTLAWTALLWQGSAKAQLAEFDSQAVAINSRGQVAGNREWGLAFLWHKGRMQSLGALSSQGGSRATAMNERGQVVGSSYAAGLARRAFIWHDGKMRSLGTLGGKESSVDGIARRGDFNFNTFYPEAINELGQVVGTSTTRAEKRHGFIWQSGRMRDLGTLGGSTSRAVSINERGQVIGSSQLRNGAEHAFVWENGELTDLGTLGGKTSFAASINDRGQIVGAAETRRGKLHAVLWTRKGS